MAISGPIWSTCSSRKATPSSAATSTSSRAATGSPWSSPTGSSSRTSAQIEAADLDGCDCVMHLAAISNDPMGDAQRPDHLRRQSRRLDPPGARSPSRPACRGSCSPAVARSTARARSSTSTRATRSIPLTAYAQSKIETEEAVSELADDSFTPVFLRNATAYGHSPMLRIDLVVNNLLGSAMAYGEIRIQSDGSPWRPLIHCRDIARAFIALAKAPKDAVHNKAINVGANSENYQVRDVGDQVQRLIPSAKIAYTGEVGADPRNYRVKFDLLYQLLPDFRLQYNLATGMEELHRKMVEHGFGKKDFEGDQFVRLRTLKHRFNRLG